MNRTHLEHAVAAALVMLVTWSTCYLVGLADGRWIGAAAGIAFFIGREYTQAERELAKARRLNLVDLHWYQGFDLRYWSRDALLDLVVPTAVCLLLALVPGLLDRLLIWALVLVR